MAQRKLTYPAFRQPSQVTFGTGSVRSLAVAEDLARAVVLVSGDAAVREALANAFQNRGIALDHERVLVKPAGEPTADSVARAAAWLGEQSFDTLVAVGGGSVLDWARLALAVSRGWLDLTSGRIRADVGRADRPALVLVPTTCGSGAEAAAVAVYLKDGQKLAVVSDAFLADRVILDAQFLGSASEPALASWLSDVLSHGVEAFSSIVPNGLAKATAIAALQGVLHHYQAADPHCRRERLMEAGYLGGVAASNCSVGIVHAFAHSVAAFGIAHGTANALGLGPGIRANAETNEMRTLLERLHLPSSDALVGAIRPITTAALSRGVPEGLMSALRDPAGREALASRMAGDVCLRTNPRRLDHDGLLAFLDDVARSVSGV